MAESRQFRLLVVEDDPGYLEFLETILSPHYSLTICETLEAAVRKINTDKFDLILSDINLQDKSGLEILMTMQMKGLLKDSPLVICSSQTDAGTKQIAESMGASAFVEKPFKSKILLEQLRVLLHPAA